MSSAVWVSDVFLRWDLSQCVHVPKHMVALETQVRRYNFWNERGRSQSLHSVWQVRSQLSGSNRCHSPALHQVQSGIWIWFERQAESGQGLCSFSRLQRLTLCLESAQNGTICAQAKSGKYTSIAPCVPCRSEVESLTSEISKLEVAAEIFFLRQNLFKQPTFSESWSLWVATQHCAVKDLQILWDSRAVLLF